MPCATFHSGGDMCSKMLLNPNERNKTPLLQSSFMSSFGVDVVTKLCFFWCMSAAGAEAELVAVVIELP